MTGIWSRLFGMSGAEIYHNFRGGTGDDARGLIEAGGRLGIVRYRYAERTKSITELTTKMEDAWQGGAAGAAQRGSGPLAVEHGLAETGLTTANKTLYNQAQAFVTAKQSVTEVPPTPEKPGIWDNVTSLGGAGRNYETQVTQVNTANDHNVAVMEAYETTSSSNASAMPTTYGRITDDYSAVGVEKPPPPPQPNQTYPPTYPGSTTGNNRPGTSTTSSTTGTTTTNPSGQKPPGSNTQNPTGTTTTPSGNRPPVGLPPRGNLPVGNQNPGNQNQPLPGMIPPGFGPNNPGGGGPRGGGGGFGPRGSGGAFGPGGSGAGGPGAGGRGGVGGGFGPGAGGAAAAESAAARGGLGGPGAAGRGGVGGMGGMGHGGRGQNGEDDTEHERPSFLVEPDPHETFGTDEVTAPPVIGE
jgi:hypothetical protein